MNSAAPFAGLAGLKADLSGRVGLLVTSAPWRALQRRFDQCAPRERLLVIVAAAALMLMGTDALWLGPALAQFRAAHRQQQETSNALAALQAEIRSVADRHAAQLRQQQHELRHWRQRVREGDAVLRKHEDSLVGPDRMLDLIGQLLTRHGEVRVRALQSMGRTDLLPAAPGGSPDAGHATAPAAARTATAASTGLVTPSLYRHGVELVLEGGYSDLLQTLKALEALPQHVLWGSLDLQVEQHPRSVLTLRVYTISRDRHWLEI